jgi:hypothetical protein
MTLKTCAPAVVLVAALATASSASAAFHTENLNGGDTCRPYTASVIAGFFHSLYATTQGGWAFCHLTTRQPWTLEYLRYVYFYANAGGGTGTGALTARLCVHSGSPGYTCGNAHTMAPAPLQAVSFGWVLPPALPPSPQGAFVFFVFPTGRQWFVHSLGPYWQN